MGVTHEQDMLLKHLRKERIHEKLLVMAPSASSYSHIAQYYVDKGLSVAPQDVVKLICAGVTTAFVYGMLCGRSL